MKTLFKWAAMAAVLTGFTSIFVSCGSSNSPSSPAATATPTPAAPTATPTPFYSAGPTTVVSSGIYQPYGIAYDSFSGSGNIWFLANSNPGTIYQYTPAGSLVSSSPYYQGSLTFKNPLQINADPSGYLYVADENNNQVEIFTPAGASVGTLTGYTKPTDAVVNAAGTTLYVVEEAGSTVTFLTYSITGTGYPKTYTPTSNSFPTSGAFDPSQSVCMALDPSGNVYVGDFGNADIIKYGPTGSGPSVFIPTATGKTPYGFAFDSSGNLFVAEDVTTSFIQEYTSAGSASVSIGGFPASTGLTGLAVDSSGNLFVSDSTHNYVFEVKK